MKSKSLDELIDYVSGAFLLCGMVVGLYWLFVVQANARTDMLLSTHDCFVQSQCSSMVQDDGHLTEDGQDCWAECHAEVSR